MGDESYAAYEVFCHFTTLKNACRIKNHFYWKFTSVPRHISQGACKDEFSMLSGQGRICMAYYAESKLKQTTFFFFF